jgi:hypothetical protein
MAIGQAMPDAGAPVLGHELHQIATSLSTSMPVNRKLEEKRSSDARAWPFTQHGIKVGVWSRGHCVAVTMPTGFFFFFYILYTGSLILCRARIHH